MPNEALAKYQEEQDLSEVKLAQRAGISRNTLRDMLAGKRATRRIAARVARKCGLGHDGQGFVVPAMQQKATVNNVTEA